MVARALGLALGCLLLGSAGCPQPSEDPDDDQTGDDRLASCC